MSFTERVREELREIGLVTAFFLAWFLFFLFIKKLVLAEYQIGVVVLGTAAISALVVAKVVVLMDKTPVVSWFRSSPVLVHVMWRSFSYTAVVFLFTVAEELFHAYRESGSLSTSLSEMWTQRDPNHAVALTLSVGLAFVVFTGAAEIDRQLGAGGLRRVFFSPRPDVKASEDAAE